jgi:hypothetical protein
LAGLPPDGPDHAGQVAVAVDPPAVAAPPPSGTRWEAAMGWCHHAGAQLFVGDFDGDNRDDMLCHDTAGHKWIAGARPQGGF